METAATPPPDNFRKPSDRSPPNAADRSAGPSERFCLLSSTFDVQASGVLRGPVRSSEALPTYLPATLVSS